MASVQTPVLSSTLGIEPDGEIEDSPPSLIDYSDLSFTQISCNSPSASVSPSQCESVSASDEEFVTTDSEDSGHTNLEDKVRGNL